jgi:hypothetical protein
MNTEVLNNELTDAELELVTAGGLLGDIAKAVAEGVATGVVMSNPLTATAYAVGYSLARAATT